jgi:hypothetical protein
MVAHDLIAFEVNPLGLVRLLDGETAEEDPATMSAQPHLSRETLATLTTHCHLACAQRLAARRAPAQLQQGAPAEPDHVGSCRADRGLAASGLLQDARGEGGAAQAGLGARAVQGAAGQRH